MSDDFTPEERAALRRFLLLLPVAEAVVAELSRDPETARNQTKGLLIVSELSHPLSDIIQQQRAQAALVAKAGAAMTLLLKLAAGVGVAVAFLRWLRDGA